MVAPMLLRARWVLDRTYRFTVYKGCNSWQASATRLFADSRQALSSTPMQ